MLGHTLLAELQAKEAATGLILLVPGVSWVEEHVTCGLDPLPDGLSQMQIDAIHAVVTAHVYTSSFQPDYIGFIHWLSTAFSTSEILAMNDAYGSFPWFCLYGNAAGMTYCITDALATAKITSAQYVLFQEAVQIYH